MAVLLGLSNELIILVTSNVRKPSHLLQFALTNKRIHLLVIDYLYEHVVFDRADYPWSFGDGSLSSELLKLSDLIKIDYDVPHSNVLHLSSMIRDKTLPAGQTVTRLTIILGVNAVGNRFQTMLSLLLPQLSSLKTLTLESISEDRLAWQREHFSLAPLAVDLSASSQTLETLDLHFYLDPGDSDGWTIGSLRHFSKLRYLSVQGGVLLSQYGDRVANIPTLDSILPPALERLRLHWDKLEELHHLEVILKEFVKDSIKGSRKMEELVVQLNDKAYNMFDQSLGEVFGKELPVMNDEARQAALNLRLTLEWDKENQWIPRVHRHDMTTRAARLQKLMDRYPYIGLDD